MSTVSNKKNIASGFKTVRNELDMTLTRFAESLEVTQSYLSQIENGNKTPSIDLLLKLKEKHMVNMEWLFTSQGHMFYNYLEGSKDGPFSVNTNGSSYAMPVIKREQISFLREIFNNQPDSEDLYISIYEVCRMQMKSWGWI